MQIVATTVDEYISAFPENVQERMIQIREIIRSTVPNVDEQILYGMPGYKTFKKPLIYFGGFKNHLGLYATPSGHQAFEKELSNYKQGKGSVQFPHDQPLPIELIQKIVTFRVKENEERYAKKSK